MVTREQAIKVMDDGATLIYRYCDDEGNYTDVEAIVHFITLFASGEERVALLAGKGNTLVYSCDHRGEGFPELFFKPEATI